MNARHVPSRRLLALAAAVTCLAVLGVYGFASGSRPAGESYQPPTAARDELEQAGDLHIFFAHQSVGGNILDGMQDVYAEHGLPVPRPVDVEDARPADRLVEARVGKNGDPLGKIKEFDRLVRGDLGVDRDVALLKLCYSDIRADTDLDEVFGAYRDTLAALERDFPEVSFVAATVPLTIRRSVAGTVKEWVGRGDRYGPEHNLARERFNAMVRAEYAAGGELFDVAAIQSTAADGRRETGAYDGQLYYALDRSYALDPGHLNDTGSKVVAESLLAVLAGR